MSRLVDRYGPWAVVTGASDGIGAATARRLAAEGFALVLVARRQDRLTELAEELRAAYRAEIETLALDLGTAAGVAALQQAGAARDIGLLVAAAGFGTAGAFLARPVADELAMLDVNCRAVLVLTHHFGNRFAARGRGGIVLFSSIVAFQGVPNTANYAATKAYVQSLAEGIGPELRAGGVDVLAVAPGPVRSGFAARAGMRMGATDSPATVAEGLLGALGRRSLVRPGPLSKLLAFALGFLPRRGRVWMMGKVMSGMAKPDHGA
ncbi:SDR family oxidoreductase [Roseomonas sp. CECT 9278]|uniref:SDR family NAD(P)-dependent oxidoreductase n=1 Tax=Roseomonas sp. CECT 9278 TaxID=2845823 RepID=UPI001E42B2E0|nr:SDR family NAD(P)-dependent oxidoreductase [Roseomonas sp. CECT 9278]CAH0131337.1 7-beta-hydroxysteroid dehydrogenase (NADP(+)) [Roseomonas sp. CECT 9278]